MLEYLPKLLQIGETGIIITEIIGLTMILFNNMAKIWNIRPSDTMNEYGIQMLIDGAGFHITFILLKIAANNLGLL